MPVVVRLATPGDLPGVAAVYTPYVTDTVVTFDLVPPTAAEWEAKHAALADAGLPFLVAEEAGAVVGYAYCSPWRPKAAYRRTAEVSIYLAPAAQGRGVGGMLLDRLVEAAGAGGVRELVAVIADASAASVGLHRSRGFDQVGVLRRVGFKLGRWVDTTLMQRSLA